MIFLKILLGVVIAAAVFFVLTFTIYFFNLDMKAASKIMPVISKHYDKVKKGKTFISMNLFDDMIKDVLEQLDQIAPADSARLEKPSRMWKDAGEHRMILEKETAYELGGKDTLGLSGCLYTTRPMLFPQGVYLYGEDLAQIKTNRSFARIVLAELEENNDEEALYRKFCEVDYVRYHIHPEGYMVRISPVNQREPVRIGKKALKDKISFSDIGQMYLEHYQKILKVKNVNVIFITHKEFDYCALDEKLRRAEQITQSLNHIFTGLEMDCSTCNLKVVCDEVEGLRELHLGKLPPVIKSPGTVQKQESAIRS